MYPLTMSKAGRNTSSRNHGTDRDEGGDPQRIVPDRHDGIGRTLPANVHAAEDLSAAGSCSRKWQPGRPLHVHQFSNLDGTVYMRRGGLRAGSGNRQSFVEAIRGDNGVTSYLAGTCVGDQLAASGECFRRLEWSARVDDPVTKALHPSAPGHMVPVGYFRWEVAAVVEEEEFRHICLHGLTSDSRIAGGIFDKSAKMEAKLGGPMPNSHSKLIAAAAKKALVPLGFHQKGRSRIWLRDHGWWVTVVEFQPSAWAEGSGLNVSAHWLWSEQAHLSFDYFRCSEPFIEYSSDAQFEPVAIRLAQSAAQEANRLHQTFTSIEAASAVLAAKEHALPQEGQGSWPAYDAGMTMALSGQTDEAATLFKSVRDERVRSAVGRVEKFLSDPVAFRREADNLIAAHRRVIGLPS